MHTINYTRLLTVALLYSLPFCIFSQNSEQKYLNITTIKGIENPVVTCVYQDTDGFVWFGSLNGLYRWDGNKAKHYYHNKADTNSMSSDQIISFLFEDKESNLWFGTLGSGAIKYNRFKDNFTTFLFNENNPELIEARWITKAFQDDNGNIWGLSITNRMYKYSLEKKEIEVLGLLYRDSANSQNNAKDITSILPDISGKFIWAGTSSGLFRYLIDEKRFESEQFKSSGQAGDAGFMITGLIQDHDSVLWISTPEKIYKYQVPLKRMNVFMTLQPNQNSKNQERIEEIINCPISDYQAVWVFTNAGIKRVNKKTGFVTSYTLKNNEQLFESSAFISAKKGRFIDKTGILWLATDNLGASFINLNNNPFQQFSVGAGKQETAVNGATAFYTDRQQNLWIGTGFNGVYQYSKDFHLLNHYKHANNNPNSLSSNYVYSIIESSGENMWIGTENGLNKLDVASGKIEHYIQEPINYEGNLPIVRIADLFLDSTGRLWVGTSQGVYFTDNCDEDVFSFVHFDSIPFIFNLTQQIFSDEEGNIWFATPTYHGIFCLTSGINNKRELINYRNDIQSPGTFFTDGALSIYEDNQNNFWLGTKEGLYDWNRKANTFNHFLKNSGLDANMIYWINGEKGNLWLLTDIGLVRFNSTLPHERKSKKFTYSDGLPFEEMYPYRFYKSPDGMMYIGGRRGSGNGFYRFHPDSIVQNTHIPSIAITNFYVRGNTFPLDSSIFVVKKIALGHKEDFFSFEFAALDYANPEKNQYAYYLEGFEEDWNYSGNRHFANYTGVPPGNYIFRVKGSNNDGYWNEEGKSIYLSIAPPPWKTWWAYLVYALAILGILFSIFYYYNRRRQLLYTLQLEHIQSEKLKEIDQMRSRFFANVSHEFRTPLTLILGPLEKVLAKTADENEQKELSIARKYTLRLHNLINQILSISKLESGKMQLHTSETNIVQLLAVFLQSFESLAKQKNIDLQFIFETREINAFVDKEKLEQVINNLLSNAFKFTGEGGKIEVTVSKTGHETVPGNVAVMATNWVKIAVSDTGAGIPPEHIEHVFVRFYQVENEGSSYFEGTGIGLALSKELVELHFGKITVESTPEKGSAFSIFLPLGNEHLKPEEIVGLKKEAAFPEISKLFFPGTFEEKEIFPAKNEIEENDLPVLLIVEDNADMRVYIRGFFNKEFNVLEAVDGEDGLEKTIFYIPDIVISDVMMPKMDGNELCKKVKSDERTCHIPVILLTARASKENRIEGLELGADDFITKPFDAEELQVRVRNLIEQRKVLINNYKITFELGPEKEPLKSFDRNELFLQKAKSVVEQHISNNEFGVENFAAEMFMSRVQLHRKLRALVDNSATEFIRSIRLSFALELLKKKDRTIAEVAYDAGFNNATYFSSSFHQKYGMSPTEYLKSLK